MRIAINYIVAGLIIFLCGCKKEEDTNTRPVVTISQPFNNQPYGVGQSIVVKGNITDDSSISSITISVKNSNNINVINTLHYSPNVKDFTLNESLLIDNQELESGSYYVSVIAKDDEGATTNKFVDIQISGLPKHRKGLFLFHNTGSQAVVTKLDSLLQPSTLTSPNGDFLDGFVNSKNQEIITCGEETGDLTGFGTLSGDLLWNKSNNSTGQAKFTGLYNAEGEVYVSYFNRDIRSFEAAGTPSFYAQGIVDYYPIKLYEHNSDLLIVEQAGISSSDRKLAAYYLASGVEKQNVTLYGEIVDMFSLNDNEIVLFINEEGQGKVRVFDINQNSIYEPFNLSSGEITDCTKLEQGKYLIAQNGEIYLVDVPAFNKFLKLGGANVNLLDYDEVNNQLAYTTGNTLKIVNYSSLQEVHSYNNSHEILALSWWFNK